MSAWPYSMVAVIIAPWCHCGSRQGRVARSDAATASVHRTLSTLPLAFALVVLSLQPSAAEASTSQVVNGSRQRLALMSRRPVWGRDIGPNYMAPREAEEQPTRPEYDPVEPLNVPMAAEREAPANGNDLDTIPEGGVYGNRFKNTLRFNDGINLAWAYSIKAGTCDAVCRVCALKAVEKESRGKCQCFANCHKGPDLKDCRWKSSDGWSNDEVTRPAETWHGACGTGDRNCTADCLSQRFNDEVSRCRAKKDPVPCVRDLEKVYIRDPINPAKDVTYCTRHELDTCESFYVLPGRDQGPWECFQSQSECLGTKAGPGRRFIPKETFPHRQSVAESVGLPVVPAKDLRR